MAHFLPELAALPLLPILIAQGRHARRTIPRLPEAAGPCTGMAGAWLSGAPVSLLAIGESPVAGVGVEMHEQAITAQFAKELATRMRRPIRWKACGENGITARDAVQRLLPQLPVQPVDIALVAFGVNDATSFHRPARWRADLHAVLSGVQERCSPQLILLSGVPPLSHFPSLPQPLRWVLGLKARSLDAVAIQAAASSRSLRHVPLPVVLQNNRALMARDGYHPSEAGCALWARALAEACIEAWPVTAQSAPAAS